MSTLPQTLLSMHVIFEDTKGARIKNCLYRELYRLGIGGDEQPLPLALRLNEDSTFLEVEVIAVAQVRNGALTWEHFESTATVTYSVKPVDLATASKAAAA